MSWEEIKSLSFQLKTIQGSASNRISERDCITIVQQLISNHNVQLYYSSDGLTVFTLEQLINEIYEELEVNHGYLDINSLEQQLNANRSLINNALKQMVNLNSTLLLISLDSYLVSGTALTEIINQLEEYILNKGSSTLDDLAALFKMSTNHLLKIINRAQLDNFTIKFDSDKEIFYSTVYLEMSKSKVKGYVRAVIRPLQIKRIANDNNLTERLTLSIMEELLSSNCIVGQFVNNNTYFVPECYHLCQLKCITDYYNQHYHIPYTLLKQFRFATTDYSAYLKEHFPNAIILSSLCINSDYFDRAEHLEALNRYGWINLLDYLPKSIHESDYSTSDYQVLGDYFMVKSELKGYRLIGYHYLLSDHFYSRLNEFIESTFPLKLYHLSESMSKTALLEKSFTNFASNPIRHESKKFNDFKSVLSNCSSAGSSPVVRKKLMKKSKFTRSVSRHSLPVSASPSPSRKHSRQNEWNQKVHFLVSSQELETTIEKFAFENFQTELDADLPSALCDELLGPISMKFKGFIQNELNTRSFNNFSVFEIPECRLSCEEKIVYLLNKLKICETNSSSLFKTEQRHMLLISLQAIEVKELISLICIYISRYLIPTNQQSRNRQKLFNTHSEQLHLASKLDSKTGEALHTVLSVSQAGENDFHMNLLIEEVQKLLSLIDITVPELNRRIERSINSKASEALKHKLQVDREKLSSFDLLTYGDIIGASFNYLYLHYHAVVVPNTSHPSILSIYLNNLKDSLSALEYTNLSGVLEHFDQSNLSNTLDESLFNKMSDVLEFLINL